MLVTDKGHKDTEDQGKDGTPPVYQSAAMLPLDGERM